MANGDTYKIAVISESQGVAMSNAFHLRATEEAPAGSELENLLDLAENNIVPALAEFTSVKTKFTCITVQRVSGITSAAFTRFINVDGDIAGDQLPTTCYIKMRYYCLPYLEDHSFGNHFQGIPEFEQSGGSITFIHVLRFATLINYLRSDPIVENGANYLWVSPRPFVGQDPAYLPVRRGHIVPCIYNGRNRQSKLCS